MHHNHRGLLKQRYTAL